MFPALTRQFYAIDRKDIFFCNRTVALWNSSLPDVVVKLKSLDGFETALHTQLSGVLYDFQD